MIGLDKHKRSYSKPPKHEIKYQKRSKGRYNNIKEVLNKNAFTIYEFYINNLKVDDDELYKIIKIVNEATGITHFGGNVKSQSFWVQNELVFDEKTKNDYQFKIETVLNNTIYIKTQANINGDTYIFIE